MAIDVGLSEYKEVNRNVIHSFLTTALSKEFYDTLKSCPICSKTTYVSSLIFHLNDYHKWSREQIADWLETLDIDLTFKVG